MTVHPDGATGTLAPVPSNTTICAIKRSPDWIPGGTLTVTIVTAWLESAKGLPATKVAIDGVGLAVGVAVEVVVAVVVTVGVTGTIVGTTVGVGVSIAVAVLVEVGVGAAVGVAEAVEVCVAVGVWLALEV
jgi:hypothetical protein